MPSSTVRAGTFRYGRRALRGDALRAIAGLVLTLGPLALLPASPWVAAALGAAAAVFAAFGARTALRAATAVEFDDAGIRAVGPLGASIAWAELREVRLDYYAAGRKRRDGWMVLRLRGAGRVRLRAESSLDGFELVAERVAEAARARGLALSERTLANFLALGIDADPAPRDQDGRGRGGRGSRPQP
ncbi:hypothetical protein [Arenibaculum pallidiluteum]|uniref:hypothetical protein n=1 Tax=Arenibaculum pallidiluteum TaxID=2812559 RepID=UPI001A969E96|nr:hypothetical protein [Arenibaculum pallidiluteum]